METNIMMQIERCRINRNIRKTKLCRAAGCSVSQYYNVLSGKSSPSFDLIIKLLGALELGIMVFDKNFCVKTSD